MANTELTDYIRQALAKGTSIEEIKSQLLGVGWKQEDIQEGLAQVQSADHPIPVEAKTKPSQPSPASENLSELAINIENISNPSRLLNFPILGVIIKVFMLIPVFLEMIPLALIWMVLSSINCLYILALGQYWQTAYEFNLKLMQFSTKIVFFFFGLTNKYPGFHLSINDHYSVSFPAPKQPSRALAIPILGIMIRFFLTYPLSMFYSFLQMASSYAYFLVGWFKILFFGKYPESIFELVRDSQLLSLRQGLFINGIDDDYPSFNISWNHRNTKYFLITLPIIIMFVLNIISLIAAGGTIKNTTSDDYFNKKNNYYQFNNTDFNFEGTGLDKITPIPTYSFDKSDIDSMVEEITESFENAE